MESKEVRTQRKGATNEGTSDKPEGAMEQALGRLRATMIEQFKTRINTDEENSRIASLVMGQRFTETFELFQKEIKEKDGSEKVLRLCISFRNTNEEEEDFAFSVSIVNSQEISRDPALAPVYDDAKRFDTLMAMATVSLNDHHYDQIDLAGFREGYKTMPKEERQDAVDEFLANLGRRVREIKRRLPRGTYQVATKAFQVWLKYQISLVTGEKIENF